MLDVFISWSGEKSRSVALALGDWLPGVINAVRPFVSAKDIYAGTRWQVEIAERLETSRFGIVCVTRENQSSPWLNFEAGALAKAVDAARVVPLAIDLKPADIEIPLGQFQAQPATDEGIGRILASINAACDPPLPDALLARAAARWWPELRETLERIETQTVGVREASIPARSDRELLEEMLGAVRSLARYDTDLLVQRTRRRVSDVPVSTDVSTIRVDISNVVAGAEPHTVRISDRTTVQDVLDAVYFALEDVVEPYTYRSQWILRDVHGAYLDSIGTGWTAGLGRQHDERLWSEIAIPSGSLLVAERCHPGGREPADSSHQE